MYVYERGGEREGKREREVCVREREKSGGNGENRGREEERG